MAQQLNITFQNIDKGYCCPQCGSFVKRYKRKFNSNMAIALIALYKYSEDKFVKVEDFLLNNGYQRCGDFSYLRFYNFIEALKEKRKDGSNRNGYYRLTSLGTMFVEKKIKAKEKFLIMNNKLEGFDGEEISIQQALGNKFDYNELMGA